MKLNHACWLLALAVAASTQAGCTKSARANRALSKADAYFKAQQYDKAELEYILSLRLKPMNTEGIRQLGYIYYAEGRLRKAYPFLDKAVEQDPQNAEARLKLGMVSLGAGKLAQAHDEALWVLDRDLGNEDALLLLAETSVSPKTAEQNRERIEFYRKQDQDRPSYHLAEGWLDLRGGDPDGAEREFRAALALDPKSGTAHLGMADMCMMHGDKAGADKEFQEAMRVLPVRSSAVIKYSEFKLRVGAVDEAVKMLEDASKKAPDYVPVWLKLAQISLAQGHYDDCAHYLDAALAHDSMNYDALMQGAALDLARGDAAKAVGDYDRIRDIYGTIPHVLYQQALAMLKNKDVTRAAENLTQAVTLQTNYLDAILTLAELNLQQGHPAAAQAPLERVVQLDPGLLKAHMLLAACLLQQRKYPDALAQYEKMADMFPNNPQTPVLAGVVLEQMGRTAEARAQFERAMSITAKDTNAPPNVAALQQLVMMDLRENQAESARARIQREIDRAPDLAELRATLARVDMAVSNYNAAETDLQKAIQIAPDLHESYLLLAQLYAKSNQQQKALDRLAELVARTNDVPALMQMAAIDEGLGRYPAERDAYEKVLAVSPNNSAALNDLAYLYSEQLGGLERAYQLAERAHELSPMDSYMSDTLGWILFKRGDYSRAMGLLDGAASALGGEPTVQYHLGMTHYKLDNEGRARAAFERAVSSKVDFPEKQQALQKLQFLAINPTNPPPDQLAELEKLSSADPSDPVLATRLASYYERRGDAQKAAAVYERTLEKLPNTPKIMISLAQLDGGPLKNPSRGLELAKAAHSLVPDDARISAVLGHLVLGSGDYKWALSLLQDAGRRLSGEPAVQFDLAKASYEVGHVTDAVSGMQQALNLGLAGQDLADGRTFLALVPASLNPPQPASVADEGNIATNNFNYVPAQMALALQKEQTGAGNEARHIYEAILAQNNLFAPAACQLALLCASSPANAEDDAKAFGYAKAVRDSFSGDAALAKALGVLAYREADYSLCISVLSDVAAQQSNDAEVQYYLGMTQYQLKQNPQSKAALKRALDLHLTPGLAQEAQRVLNELN